MIFETLKFWVNCLNPENFQKIMEENKGKENLKDAVKTIFFSSLVPAIGVAIYISVLGLLFGAVLGTLLGRLTNPDGSGFGGIFGLGIGAMAAVFGIGIAVFSIIVAPIGFLIGQGISWTIAKLLGGKGSYTSQTYFASYAHPGYAVLSILVFIPCIGNIVALILGLLYLYLTFLLLKKVHELDALRAIAVIVIPTLVVIAIYVLIWLLIYIPIMSSSAIANRMN